MLKGFVCIRVAFTSFQNCFILYSCSRLHLFINETVFYLRLEKNKMTIIEIEIKFGYIVIKS